MIWGPSKQAKGGYEEEVKAREVPAGTDLGMGVNPGLRLRKELLTVSTNQMPARGVSMVPQCDETH